MRSGDESKRGDMPEYPTADWNVSIYCIYLTASFSTFPFPVELNAMMQSQIMLEKKGNDAQQSGVIKQTSLHCLNFCSPASLRHITPDCNGSQKVRDGAKGGMLKPTPHPTLPPSECFNIVPSPVVALSTWFQSCKELHSAAQWVVLLFRSGSYNDNAPTTTAHCDHMGR